MLGSGVDGVPGMELMMFAGGADKVSEGARVSQGSSDSTFIVLIFFFFLSSFSFFLGRDRSNIARSKTGKIKQTEGHVLLGGRGGPNTFHIRFTNTFKNRFTYAQPPSDQNLFLTVCRQDGYQRSSGLDGPG